MDARRLAMTGVALAVALAAPDARAFCRSTTCNPKKDPCRVVDSCTRTGAPLSWTVMPIPFRFHGHAPERLERDEARGAIRLAFARWTEVVCSGGRRTSLRFQELPEIPAATPRGKQPFGVYFRDDGWPHADADETLALTTQYFGQASGEILYSDIEINSGEKAFTVRDSQTGTDLEAVITHEVGHYIGLAHSPESESIMAPRYCQSDVRCAESKELARDLGADDVAAVCALYPPAGPASSDDAPAASCALGRSTSPSDDASIHLAAIAVAFCSLACRRRITATTSGARRS